MSGKYLSFFETAALFGAVVSFSGWSKIEIGVGNGYLTITTIHFGSTASKPQITKANLSAVGEKITVAVEAENITADARLFAVAYGEGGE